MNYKLTIHCTQEHLEKAKWCGIDESKQLHTEGALIDRVTNNCWIAVAVQDIFPLSDTTPCRITNNYRIIQDMDTICWSIELPETAKEEIVKFDDCRSIEKRMELEPFSFTVDIPQETLDIIMQCNGLRNMQELNEIVFRTPHLELVEAPQMS